MIDRGKGLTLVEIMIALAVVITIFGPIITMLSTATIRAYRGGDETVATIYANDVLEIIRGAPFEAFLPNDQPMSLRQILYEHNIPTGYELEKYDERFSVTARVGPVEGYSPDDMRRVIVEVSYPRRRQPDSTRLVRLLSFYTPTD